MLIHLKSILHLILQKDSYLSEGYHKFHNERASFETRDRMWCLDDISK